MDAFVWDQPTVVTLFQEQLLRKMGKAVSIHEKKLSIDDFAKAKEIPPINTTVQSWSELCEFSPWPVYDHHIITDYGTDYGQSNSLSSSLSSAGSSLFLLDVERSPSPENMLFNIPPTLSVPLSPLSESLSLYEMVSKSIEILTSSLDLNNDRQTDECIKTENETTLCMKTFYEQCGEIASNKYDQTLPEMEHFFVFLYYYLNKAELILINFHVSKKEKQKTFVPKIHKSNQVYKILHLFYDFDKIQQTYFRFYPKYLSVDEEFMKEHVLKHYVIKNKNINNAEWRLLYNALCCKTGDEERSLCRVNHSCHRQTLLDVEHYGILFYYFCNRFHFEQRLVLRLCNDKNTAFLPQMYIVFDAIKDIIFNDIEQQLIEQNVVNLMKEYYCRYDPKCIAYPETKKETVKNTLTCEIGEVAEVSSRDIVLKHFDVKSEIRDESEWNLMYDVLCKEGVIMESPKELVLKHYDVKSKITNDSDWNMMYDVLGMQNKLNFDEKADGDEVECLRYEHALVCDGGEQEREEDKLPYVPIFQNVA